MAARASLDTNCLLRWILGDLPDQAALVATRLASGQTFHIADQALIEMIFVLEKNYRLSRTAIADIIVFLMAEGRLEFNREFFARLLVPYQAHSSLSVVDCYLALEADQADASPLLTFDKKLAQKMDNAALLSLA